MYQGCNRRPAVAETGIWRGVQAKGTVLLEISAKSKYQSKWCGNPLALTIYVNANGLLLSPKITLPFVLRLSECQATFHLRG
jgi:hypothetical protein